jgi:hypothetical protein
MRAESTYPWVQIPGFVLEENPEENPPDPEEADQPSSEEAEEPIAEGD